MHGLCLVANLTTGPRFVTRLHIVRTKIPGSRKNLEVTTKRDDGDQVPRTRRTDAWARGLSVTPKHLSTSPRHTVDYGQKQKAETREISKLLPSDFDFGLLQQLATQIATPSVCQHKA